MKTTKSSTNTDALIHNGRLNARLYPSVYCVVRFTLVVVCLIVATPPLATAQQALSSEIVAQLKAAAREKATWTETECKMESRLILASKRRHGRPIAQGYPILQSTIQRDRYDRALVDIDATVTQDVLDLIAAVGGEVIVSVPRFDSIRAAIPVVSLESVAAHPNVRTIDEADRFITNKINTSEGDTAHKADVARATFGVDGTGVSVGVISNGVNSLSMIQASGDLPPLVTVLPGEAGSGDEGTAMLEIVHDLAPGANLFFARGFGGPANFANNILDLAAAGCHVIVDDLFYTGEPVFQDGIIAQAVEEVAANGVSYFSSAGNSGNFNDRTAGVYEGDFNALVVDDPNFGTVIVHDYGSMNPGNRINAAGLRYLLQWSDPENGSTNDYDLAIIDSTQTQLLALSDNPQTGKQDPQESIEPRVLPGSGVGAQFVVVKHSSEEEDRYFHLNTIRGRLQIATDGQTGGHAATENGFGIAAVDISAAPGFDGQPFDESVPVEPFSSDGPRRVFYEADGTPYTPGNFSSTGGVVRNKPDFAAADGVMTATPGFETFFGTSAAAPHAAALAALLIDQGAFTTPDQVRAALSSTAIDIEQPGMDRDSGYGIIDINAALQSGCDYGIDPPSRSVPASGAIDATIDITTGQGCPWSVTTTASFITLTSATSGNGSAQVTYSVAANNGFSRMGTIDINGIIHTVTQEPCQLPETIVDPTNQSGCLGGSATFVAAGAGSAPLSIQWQVNEGIGFKNIAGANGPTLTVDNITQDMDGYLYHAVFYNGCGDAATVPAVLTVGPLDAPTGVQASDGTFPDRVRVRWNAVSGATGYRVFRSQNSNGSGWVDISGPITDLTFDDTTATTGMTTGCNATEISIVYRYFVVATNASCQSGPSNTASGTISTEGKQLASLTPETLGDVLVLILTLAALYRWQRRRNFLQG